ncbi:MAG: HAMP domain-containing histidine kinase [Deltaproteobacteria bacterium]|nr:HAMP domain-containing histidine kinase [Deltaproteobacteria bacterium]
MMRRRRGRPPATPHHQQRRQQRRPAPARQGLAPRPLRWIAWPPPRPAPGPPHPGAPILTARPHLRDADLPLAGESSIAGRWLIALRWWAALGALACLVVAVTWLDMELPLARLLAGIGVVLLSNAALALAFRRASGPPRPVVLAAILAFDTGILTAMLAWSGGVHNPFSTLYLVHATLAATTLTAAWTWGLVGLAVVGYGSLFFLGGHAPPGVAEAACPHCGGAAGMSLHLQGMWVAFVLSAALVAHFVGRLNGALRRRTQALIEVSAVAARHQRLAAMTTLAAGAAHELATPVGTIALVARELERDAQQQQASAETLEDLRLIGSEAERCRDILDRMAARSLGPSGEVPVAMTVGELVDALVRELPAELGARVDVEVAEGSLPVVLPERGMLHALRSLVDNAADASGPGGRVRVAVEPGAEGLRFAVEDRGAGIPEALRERVGEPFFTTKEPGRGMGLGVFLARAFAERLGGELRFEVPAGGGTRAVLAVPRRATA